MRSRAGRAQWRPWAFFASFFLVAVLILDVLCIRAPEKRVARTRSCGDAASHALAQPSSVVRIWQPLLVLLRILPRHLPCSLPNLPSLEGKA